jgi:hypothetical protein
MRFASRGGSRFKIDLGRRSTIRPSAWRVSVGSALVQSGIGIAVDERVFSLQRGQNGAAPESNRPSVGLPRRTGFEDRLGHRARAAPAQAYPADGLASAAPAGVGLPAGVTVR